MNKKKGAFSLDGKMIDKPIIERSLKIIAKAKKSVCYRRKIMKIPWDVLSAKIFAHLLRPMHTNKERIKILRRKRPMLIR